MKQNKILKRAIVFTCTTWLSLSCWQAYSQQYKTHIVTPTSPEASRLVNSIKYPVGYNSGSVDITIPLFEMQLGEITLPISLSYNTKGVKQSEATPYMGVGWSLNAQPTIARSPSGRYDFYGYYNYNDPMLHSKDKYLNTGIMLTELDKGSGSFPDMSADDYFYKLPTTSGSFTTKHNGAGSYSMVTVPYDPIKITPTKRVVRSGSTVQFTEGAYTDFRIHDDKGYTYNFDYSETEKENIIPMMWHASGIYSPNSHTNIRFEYIEKDHTTWYPASYTEVEDVIGSSNISNLEDKIKKTCADAGIYPSIIGRFYSSNTEYYIYHKHDIDTSCSNKNHCEGFLCQHSSPSTITTPVLIYKTIRSKLISKITYDQGSVEFERSVNGKLIGINIKNTNNEIQRNILFEYYTNADQSVINYDQYSVLTNITIKDKENKIAEKYDLAYNNPHLLNVQGSNINFWGYVSGRSMPASFCHYLNIPIHTNATGTSQVNIGYNDREVAPLLNGMLISITNYLGMKTGFSYESDQYVKYYPDANGMIRTYNKVAGGLRIKAISESDPREGTVYRKEFIYGKNGNGLGVIRRQFNESNLARTRTRLHENYPAGAPLSLNDVIANSAVGQSRVRTFQSSPVSKSTYGSTPVAYDQVVEYRQSKNANGQWENLDKTVYTYNYNNDYGHGVHCSCDYHKVGDGVELDANDDWQWGQLLSKQEYKFENGNYVAVNSSKNKYVRYGYDYDMGYVPHTLYIRPDYIYSSIKPDAYYGFFPLGFLRSMGGCMRKSEETITTYSNNASDSMVVQNKYTYTPIRDSYYIKSISTYTEQDTLIEERKYPFDFAGVAVLATLVDKNRISPIVQTTNTYMGNRIEITTNDYIVNSAGTTGISAIRKKLGNTEDTIVRFNHYDNFGNPCHMQKGSLSTVYIWGYEGRKLVAEIKNATYAEVTTALTYREPKGFSSTNSPDYNLYMNLYLQASLSDAQITVFEYDILFGIKKITSPIFRSTHYNYDSTGRLIDIKDDTGKKVESYIYNIRTN